MRDPKAADRYTPQIFSGRYASTYTASQRVKGSRRYHSIRRALETEATRRGNIFALFVLLVMLLGFVVMRSSTSVPAQLIEQPASPDPAEVPQKPLTEHDPLETQIQNFLRRVHRKESSSGTNTNPQALHNICRAQGKSNEYGYGGMALMMCFPSHQVATAEVTRWYREHRPQMESEAMTYCYYALGARQDTCHYWEEVKEW